ncbi:alkylmercury lyase family protein [Saccharothrix sp. NRRL B-16314]|uniref:alkylmercury lyase family protein n=1 Tax=Saccharothrix sp. NRRL B-16314 TaxID=1463825 RepID=UPI000690307F|nr:alkylmercury lyase family protein [Saccharothrix sp. NRRL B-16314]
MTEPTDLALNKCSASAGLTTPARQLHHGILAAFADTGRPPGLQDLEDYTHDHDIDLEPALRELTGCDLLAVDHRGRIRAAYPFSPTPTRHAVTWAGGPTTYAMCAVDALGMSAMLDHPVVITSTEPDSDATIIIRVDRDQATWTPDTAVVLAGTATDDGCCPSADRTCGYINFFTSTQAACNWADAHPEITATVLDQTQALASGITEFGALLQPTSETRPA